MLKPRLFTPGPTPLSPRVREVLGRDIPHHRSEEFKSLFRECRAGLQRFLKTSGETLILASSGSGAMEAAVVNLLSPGERMLVCVAGSFGQRWADIGRAHGREVTVVEAPWGEAVQARAVEAALDRDPAIRAVFVQHSESSTGSRHDVEAFGRLVAGREDVLLVIDAISGAGAMPLETEAWGLDVVVVGSQKALALPPGLTFLSLSPRAIERLEKVQGPRFYFDLRRERKGQAEGLSAFTPAIAHVVALREALLALEGMGGVEALVRNAGNLAAMTRAAASALDLPLVAPRDHGDALTALYPPAGLGAPEIVKGLRAEFGATVAGGQGKLEGRIFRIAHLGHYDPTDILGLLGSLEITLHRLAHRFPMGAGVAAAQTEYLRRTR